MMHIRDANQVPAHIMLAVLVCRTHARGMCLVAAVRVMLITVSGTFQHNSCA
jgi:hypothetical protein